MFNEYRRKYPVLWKLIFVLKQFVKQRDLNDVFAGGISSFALALMCISFFQKHPTYKPTNEDANLALLIDFFELYGKKFDFEHFGISIKNGGDYLPRNMLPCDGDQQLFCVENPLNDWLNVCGATYRGPDIKQSFYEAYTILKAAISSSGTYAEICPHNGILGRIVYVSQDFIEFRKWILESFDGDGETMNSQINVVPQNVDVKVEL